MADYSPASQAKNIPSTMIPWPIITPYASWSSMIMPSPQAPSGSRQDIGSLPANLSLKGVAILPVEKPPSFGNTQIESSKHAERVDMVWSIRSEHGIAPTPGLPHPYWYVSSMPLFGVRSLSGKSLDSVIASSPEEGCILQISSSLSPVSSLRGSDALFATPLASDLFQPLQRDTRSNPT
ncbi:hypothetical protein BKA70DRAFT_1439406 [Coprinopsis sp. MPI-PUGE-AT-0042]|nr:hypothetical protein BKA70DRAFT_1439406 [Coprinopsis sp. MPI-PUGE-AT-0042]